jgi:hypothetical protein
MYVASTNSTPTSTGTYVLDLYGGTSGYEYFLYSATDPQLAGVEIGQTVAGNYIQAGTQVIAFLSATSEPGYDWAIQLSLPTTTPSNTEVTETVSFTTTLVTSFTYTNLDALCIVGNQLKIEAIPAFGQDDSVASFSVAGSRQSDKIPVQAAPTSLTITAAWNPSDTVIQQVRTDSVSGITERTYVIKATDGTGVVEYGFNARVGNFQIDAQPGAEAKATFTLHPRGNASGLVYSP